MHGILVWIDAHPLRFTAMFLTGMAFMWVWLIDRHLLKLDAEFRTLKSEYEHLRWRLRNGIKVD